MNYVISDIHGHYEKYKQMLEKIQLKDEDTLYVLGDVLDRGPDGIKVLLDMMMRPNIIPILGNHEYMASICIPWIFREVTEESLDALDQDMIDGVSDWLSVGGEATINASCMRDEDTREMVMDYLSEFQLYDVVRAGGKTFVLVHAGLDNFIPGRDLDDYHFSEMLFQKPNYDKVYFKNAYLVTGHTPTRVIWEKDQIYTKNHHFAIDCGCAYGGKLACLCLDTLEEFYV